MGDVCVAGGCGRAAGWWLRLVVLLLVAGCGGGGDDSPFSLTIGSDFATPLDKAAVSGSVSLPAGSERTGGTAAVPYVTCQLGAHSMTWSNSANGSNGAAVAYWDCPKDVAAWSAQRIPLAPGANPVTVTMTDSQRTTQASVTITRN